MKNIITLLFFVAISQQYGFAQQSEVEPNGSFATANYFGSGTQVMGTIGCSGDVDDYFVTNLPSDGTLRIYLECTNTSLSNSQYFYFQLLDKNQSLIYQHFPGYINSGVTKYDTLDFYCMAKDTFYFRMTGATTCFQYKIKYEMINNIPLHIDTAGNEYSANAIYFNATDSIVGKIRYTAYSGAGGTDMDDYFKTYIPSDGTLRVYLESKNTSSSNSQYVYFQLLDKNQSQVYQHFPGYINSGVTKYDTLDFYCMAKDTFYFRMTGATTCFQYKIKYEMFNDIPLHIDTAGNESSANAIYFNATDSIVGKIKYTAYAGAGGTDNDDYFKTYIPSDGTLRVYLESKNTSSSNFQYVYFQLLDKNQSQVYQHFPGYFNSGVTKYDTLDFYCMAKDTFYFRMTGATTCFQYKIKYEMFNDIPLHIDTAGNESSANAIYFNATDSIVGKIRYTAYAGTGGTDMDDYFKTYIPSDGTLRVYLESKNTSYINSQCVYLQLLDKNQSQIYQHFSGYINPGVTKYDTLDFYCMAKDTFYFRMTGATSCFQYKIKYEIINYTPLHIDTAGNDVFANAIYFNATDSIVGKIKYTAYAGAGGTDNDDFFKSYIPSDGTLRVYLERKNTSYINSQYVYFQLLDKNQSQLYSNYNGYINPGVTKYDTLDFYCTAKDTFYFRMTSATTCFQYKIKYEVTLGADKSTMVCPGFTTDISKFYNTAPFNIVNWTNMGGGAMPPLTAVPNGVYRLTVEKTGIACSKDTAFVTVGLHPKPNLGNDTIANVCPGFTADLTQFKNTNNLTTQWLGTSTPTAVGAGTYTLIATNSFGCMDTVVITIGLHPKPNLGNDTVANVCPGFTADLTQFKNTSNLTTQWLGTSTPTAVGAGTYTLIVTNSFGCMDTVVITIGLHPKPNLGNDTVANVCPGFTTDLTQFKNTSNLTTQWLGTSTPTAVGAGTYSLIATNSFGCMDTVVITIGLQNGVNLGNDTILHAWLGDTVNFASIIDTTGFAGMGWTHNWTSNIFGNSGYTKAIMNAADTITATIIATNQYGCSDTVTETIYPVISILPAIGVTNLTANVEVVDTSGWTHYYHTNNSSNKADDILLLSLKKNGNSIGNIGNIGFAVKNAATINAGNNLGVHITSPLVSNSTNYYVMHRFWEVTPTTQPTSAVGVRFYFNTQDYNDVNGSFSNLKSLQDLILYHLLNGNPDPSTNWTGATLPVISIMHSTQPTDTTWVLGSITNNGYFAEFKVNSFSGGGAGFTGNNLPLPIKFTKLIGTTKGLNSDLNWESSQEDNIKNYTLQRSEDGVIFNSLETFSTKNNTKNNYHYTDVNAGMINEKLYYRLLINEKNSQSFYSEVVVLNFENIRNNYILFPNPSNGTITVTGVGAFTNYHIIDVHSKLVMSGNIHSNLLSVDISKLADGSYYLQLFHKNGNTASLQFTKKE